MFHMKLILVKLILAFVVVTVSLVACSGSLSEVETERLAGGVERPDHGGRTQRG